MLLREALPMHSFLLCPTPWMDFAGDPGEPLIIFFSLQSAACTLQIAACN